jgi:hypothetical protein
MATGFQSNYNDSGYTLTVNTWYNQNNAVVTSVSSLDIYRTTQNVGVYMVNGSFGTSNATWYPLFGSYNNLNNVGIPNGVDDGWLVYPGFGFLLYNATGWSGTQSRFYVNTDNRPTFFYITGKGFSGKGTEIRDSGGGAGYSDTRSVRIYFRGSEIGINGLYQ